MANDDAGGAIILFGAIGFLLGLAAMAPPLLSEEEKRQKEIEEKTRQKAKELEADYQRRNRQLKIYGTTIMKLSSKPAYYSSTFNEASYAHIQGFARSSVNASSLLIESLLKEQLGNGSYYELIEKAYKANIITEREYHRINTIRYDRNEADHDISIVFNETDSAYILNLAVKIIEELIK